MVGLGDEIVGAALDAADDGDGIAERGQQDDGDMAFGRVVLDLAAEFVAGHARHQDVGEDEVERGGVEKLEAVLAIRGHFNLKIRFQKEPQLLRLSLAVLDDQDAAHRWVPRCKERSFCGCLSSNTE